MEKSFSTFESIEQALLDQNCKYALVKVLAKNQDNEKNQIYLGAERGLSQLLPGIPGVRSGSTSTRKRHSVPGQLITELKLEFSWLWPDAQPSPAPSTRIIDYFQYAADGETRLSGFIRDCPRAPRALRRDEMDAFGRRVLVIGVAEERTFGIVVTDRDGQQLVDRLSALPFVPNHPVLRLWELNRNDPRLNPDVLIEDLRKIAGRPLPACALHRAGESPVPQRARQGGGWTLEANLGIPRNSASGPDKHGFEIKSVSGDQVTIITTEPDLGARPEGFVDYMKRFGWESPVRPGHWVFNGAHRCNHPNNRTHAVLIVDHWDHTRNAPAGTGEPRILLIETRTDQLIAGWSYRRIAEHWNKKHAGAVYVETIPSNCDGGRFPSHYSYGPTVCIGIGTNPIRYFQNLARGEIYLDPGDSLSAGGTQKRRTQWRIRGNIRSALAKRLEPLYFQFDVYDLP